MGLINYSYREFTQKIKKIGFIFERQAKGSHEVRWNEDEQRAFTVPNHANDSISIGVVKSFLKLVKLTAQEFKDL